MKFPEEDQIRDMVIMGDKIFIVTKVVAPPPRNVYCFSTDKEFLWQIQELAPDFNTNDLFVGFTPESYDGLAANTWGGFRYVLNPENGKILGCQFVK